MTMQAPRPEDKNDYIAEDAPREWTLMFFCGTDNNLAPSVISQFKGMKDAGFHQEVNVLVRYDPNERGVPTRIFDVNRHRRDKRQQAVHDEEFKAVGEFKKEDRRESEGQDPEKHKEHDPNQVGDGSNTFIRNMDDDVMTCPRGTAKTRGPAAESPKALKDFLQWCVKHRPARHYMLFLVGHGMIVGNDAFLPDDNPGSAISLKELGDTLEWFKSISGGDKVTLELVGMHSCSMSAIEVAYELQGKANYMIASEGISFIGTWPYRQLLKKTFNRMKWTPGGRMDEDDIRLLMEKLYFHCLYNSTDFKYAGYAADLCLCNLTKVKDSETPLRGLTQALKKALETECGERLIQQAHLKSQSYWQENYTDLYDFCKCLHEQCDVGTYALCLHVKSEENCVVKGGLDKIAGACLEMMNELEPTDGRAFSHTLYTEPDKELDEFDPNDVDKTGEEIDRRVTAFDKLVVFSEFLGPTYQYSHGLSIYFPWSRPIDPSPDDITPRERADGGAGVLDKYKKYAFTEVLGKDSWHSFLDVYFYATQRWPREVEDGLMDDKEWIAKRDAQTGGGGSGSGGNADTSLPPIKSSPTEAGGAGCTCGSIKNYSTHFLKTFKERWCTPKRKKPLDRDLKLKRPQVSD